jgi:hypothetical protein
MRRLVMGIALICGFSFIGCGAMFNGSNKVIEVQGSPAGAKITANPDVGEYTLPTGLTLSRKHSYVLTFSKEGYKDAKVKIGQSAQFGIILLDVLFTGLIGVVVDAATGDWNNLSPDQVSVTLEKVTVGVEGPDVIRVHLDARDGKEKTTEQIALKSDVPVSVRIEQQ